MHNNRISERAVRNRLREAGLYPRRPHVGPPLAARRRENRLTWLNAHRPRVRTHQHRRQVLFSDESRFLLYRLERRQRMYRCRGERFADAFLIERDRFGGNWVMVWAGICHGHKTPLIFIEGNLTAYRYRETVLVPHVIPFVRFHNVLFQQDNARSG